MDRLIAANTIPYPGGDTAPSSGTPGMATDGNPVTAQAATIWPAYAWNMIEEEIRNVVVAAGITPAASNWTQLLQALTVIGRRLQVFTASGTFTVPAGVSLLRVQLVGGGAGGGFGTTTYGGAGGGAGGYGMTYAAVTPGQVIAATVGAGGSAGVYSTTTGAGSGGTTSFGSILSASGGAPGASASSNSGGGIGGTAYGSGVLITGGSGTDGNNASTPYPGNGGASFFGGGGRGSVGSTPTVQNGQAWGSGAGGEYNNFGNGGTGAPGGIIVEF